MSAYSHDYRLSLAGSAFATSLIFIASLIFFSFSLGNRPFATRGEGREALVVKAILSQDNFILPLRNGVDVPSKPPMFHWVGALTAKLPIVSKEFAVRFPSALFASSMLAIMFFIICNLRGALEAGFSLIITASSFEFLRSAGNARVDMCFAFFVTVGLLFLLQAIISFQARSSSVKYFLLGGFFIGGAGLAKGPAGIILPLAICGLYVLWISRRDFFANIKNLPYSSIALSLIVAFFVTSSWYVFAYLQGGESFLYRQLFQENFARIVEVEGENPGHVNPFYMGTFCFLAAMLPWCLFLPQMIVSAKHSIFKKREDETAFFVIWIFVFICAVTISLSKRVVYFLPTIPAFSILLSLTIRNLLAEEVVSKSQRRIFSSILIALAGFLAFTAFIVVLTTVFPSAVFLLPLSERDLFKADFIFAILGGESSNIVLTFSLIFLLAGFVIYYIKNLKMALMLFATAIILTYFASAAIFLPAATLSESPREFMQQVNHLVPQGVRLLQFADQFYSAAFYARGDLQFSGDVRELKIGDFVVCDSVGVSKLRAHYPGLLVRLRSANYAGNGKDFLSLIELK